MHSGEVSNELRQAAQIQEMCQIQVHECLKPTLLPPQSRLLLLFPENKISCSYFYCPLSVQYARSMFFEAGVGWPGPL